MTMEAMKDLKSFKLIGVSILAETWMEAANRFSLSNLSSFLVSQGFLDLLLSLSLSLSLAR